MIYTECEYSPYADEDLQFSILTNTAKWYMAAELYLSLIFVECVITSHYIYLLDLAIVDLMSYLRETWPKVSIVRKLHIWKNTQLHL